jgi:hypothetical protein
MTMVGLGLVACGPGEEFAEPQAELSLAHVEQKAVRSVGPLQIARSQHCSMRLPDGKVLFVGGFIDTNSRVTATTELYDPATGTTTFRAPMIAGRRAAECLPLRDGSLLVMGGVNDSSVINSVEKYDPATNTWTQLNPIPSGGVFYGMATTQLADGRVLIAGGNSYHSEAYLFDPTANTWVATGSLNVGRTYPKAIKLPDNRVLAMGGLGENNRRAVEIYTPATGTWSLLAPMLRDSGEPAVGVLPDGRIFVGEMDDPNAPLQAQVYDFATNSWTVLPPSNFAHSWGAQLVLVNGQPVVAGGTPSYDGAPMPVERFDFTTQQWTTVGQLATSRQGFTLDTLTDGSVLVAGGSQVNTSLTYATLDLITFGTPPPSSSTEPLSYTAANTNSAQQNTVNRTFTLNAGDTVEVGTCNLTGASASGDTYLRLFGAGTQVAFSDDSCGGTASFIQYTAPTAGTYELRAGCYSSTSCGGTVTFRITPAKP